MPESHASLLSLFPIRAWLYYLIYSPIDRLMSFRSTAFRFSFRRFGRNKTYGTHPPIEADEPEYGGGRNGRCRPVWVARLVAN